MKKILFTLLICLFMIPGVNADTKQIIYSDHYGSSSNPNYVLTDYDSIWIKFSDKLNSMYNEAISTYNETFSIDFPYYHISFKVNSSSNAVSDTFSIWLTLNMYEDKPNFNNIYTIPQPKTNTEFKQLTIICTTSSNECQTSSNSANSIPLFNEYNSNIYFNPLAFYDVNYDLINNTEYDIQIDNTDGSLYSIYRIGDSIPSLITTINNRMKEVNLANYEYVILNLKDYSKKNAFETNLQVKGSIAITPVYEFGTVEKENITDLCNTAYSDFTDYRFFVLKNDLINNAVYIVKNCQEGSSSFRFDSTVFNITYVTAENVDDPVITFGGVDYHTIPFNKLSNTVNKNEEEGFIPGANEGFDPFGSIGDYISSFWNSLTTFMGLVTKFFNTLPIEIRAISITMFTTACTLGLLKIIKS